MQRKASRRQAAANAAMNRRVEAEMQRLPPLLPDMDPHDLHLILCAMDRPLERRRFLLKRIRPGVHGF